MMNVLIIDDFNPIVETIRNNIDWGKLGVKEVYQANSAKQAKLILANFRVDVMLCDIEMPEENGLELFSWAKERFPELECIFLTSHAEFDYAISAIKLGSFDYVLQPAKFEDIESAVSRAIQKIVQKQRYSKLQEASIAVADQFDSILELMKLKWEQKKYDDSDALCNDYASFVSQLYDSRKCSVRQMLVSIEKWNKISDRIDSMETGESLKKTAVSMFDEEKAKVAVCSITERDYWVLVIAEECRMSEQIWIGKIHDMESFINTNLGFTVSVYAQKKAVENKYAEKLDILLEESKKDHNETGVFISEDSVVAKSPSMNQQVEQAIEHIRKNLSVNITRTEVAKEVNLSEEYFSRLFRKETGETFKDYVVGLKINEAKKLLDNTSLSVGIIASKVGYSNFSHFSKTFREITGMSPVDYKKRNKEQNG